MQTFDVSANILNDRLTFSTSRPKKMSVVTSGPAVEEHMHVEQVPAVRSLVPCSRSKLNDSFAIAVLQLVFVVVLFAVLVQRQRLDVKMLCGAVLLMTPLVVMRTANLAPVWQLLLLLVLHDTLIVVVLAT